MFTKQSCEIEHAGKNLLSAVHISLHYCCTSSEDTDEKNKNILAYFFSTECFLFWKHAGWTDYILLMINNYKLILTAF